MNVEPGAADKKTPRRRGMSRRKAATKRHVASLKVRERWRSMSSLDCDDFGLNQSRSRKIIDCGRRKGFIPGAAAMAVWLAIVPLAGAAAIDEFALDPARTHISFSVDAIGLPRTEGEFHVFDGRIAIDFEHPAMSRVAFRVEAGSIDAGSAALSDALKSAAFFDTARFADIAFVSTKVEKIDEQTVRVAGELTMLGVTRPLSVDVEVHRLSTQPHARFDVKAHTTIDRLEFGMSAGYPLISRDVNLVVASEFAKD